MSATGHRTQASSCPSCAALLDAATGVGHEGGPKPGDLSICFNCGELNLFDESLQVRTADAMELLHFQLSDDWPMIQRAQTLIKARQLPKS